MKNRIFAGAVNIYGSEAGNPDIFHVILKMKDPVNGAVLKNTLATTIKRYPYFKVREVIENEEIFLEESDEPIPVIHSEAPADSHMLALSWWDDCICISVHSGLTDETSLYQFIKSLLYYYSSKYYSCTFSSCRIRFTGTEVPEAERADPLEGITRADTPGNIYCCSENVYDLSEGAGSTERNSLRCLRVPEKEYLNLAGAAGCSPDTVASLLLARAVSAGKLANKNTVIALMTDMREALGAPSAHQPLQCFVTFSIPNEPESGTFHDQAEALEEYLKQQRSQEAILEKAACMRAAADRILEMETLADKRRCATDLIKGIASSVTASVSYRGMADYDDAEQFVKGFYLDASPLHAPIHLSLCSMNGYFYFNMSQYFERGCILKQSGERNGICWTKL